MCSVHPEREAGLQCMVCLRCKVPTHLSYHCSVDCLKSHWNLHKEYHKQQPPPNANGEQQQQQHGGSMQLTVRARARRWTRCACLSSLPACLPARPLPTEPALAHMCAAGENGYESLTKNSSLTDSWVEVRRQEGCEL